jgi:hypothetical protein
MVLSSRWSISLRIAIAGASVLGLSCSCGGGSSSTVLSVGGTYQTAVTLVPGGTCSGVTVQSNPTTVTQTPGSTTLTVSHAGNSYPGSVETNGHFTTVPTLVGGASNQSQVTIAGQFSPSGFDATVTVQQIQPSACTYMVHWVGTKNGSPNTFP